MFLLGSRFGAGTTASVSMQMYGSKGRSQVGWLQWLGSINFRLCVYTNFF